MTRFSRGRARLATRTGRLADSIRRQRRDARLRNTFLAHFCHGLDASEQRPRRGARTCLLLLSTDASVSPRAQLTPARDDHRERRGRVLLGKEQSHRRRFERPFTAEMDETQRPQHAVSSHARPPRRQRHWFESSVAHRSSLWPSGAASRDIPMATVMSDVASDRSGTGGSANSRASWGPSRWSRAGRR